MLEITEAINELDDALQQLDITLTLIEKDPNPIIETFTKNVKCDIDKVDSSISEFVQYRQIEILNDIFEERRLFARCDKLLDRCGRIFTKQILYMGNKMSNVDDTNIISKINKELIGLYEELMTSHNRVIHNLEENRTHINLFITLLKYEFESYCRLYYQGCFTQLKNETRKYKEYPGAKLTEEAWGKVLGDQLNALDLAVKGKLMDIKEEDERFAIYDKEKLTYENNLLVRLSMALQDDSIFDFEFASEPYINLYEHLTYENSDLFFWIVLRHDIIVSEMHPEQKSKFMVWFNAKPKQNEYSSHKEKTDSNPIKEPKGDTQANDSSKQAKEFLLGILTKASCFLTRYYDMQKVEAIVDEAFCSEHKQSMISDLTNEKRQIKCACMILGKMWGLSIYQAKSAGKFAEKLEIKDPTVATLGSYINKGKRNEEKISYIDWLEEHCQHTGQK